MDKTEFMLNQPIFLAMERPYTLKPQSLVW